MADASESSITSALEAQSKSMAAQSRLLQQIAERLDAQDRHWATLERRVTTNAHAIGVLEAKIGTADLTQIRADLARSLESQMDSHVAEFQATAWERIDSVETTLSTRVAALEQSSSTCESWRPFIEHSVGFNHSTTEALRAEVSRIAARVDLPQAPVPPRASILGAYEATGGRPPVSALHIDGPWGHGVNHYCREGGQGFSNTHGPLPPNGMQPASDFVPFIQPAPHHDGLVGTLYQQPSLPSSRNILSLSGRPYSRQRLRPSSKHCCQLQFWHCQILLDPFPLRLMHQAQESGLFCSRMAIP
jgi:hypothetical protein